MADIITYACSNPQTAQLILIGLLLLAGLTFPISEDLVIISAGILAGSCLPDEKTQLLLCVYFALIVADWETYWLGRFLGPKIYDIPWFKWAISPKKIEKLHSYYERYGVFIFLLVRFIPGLRLVFYLSVGLGKMPFYKLVLRDAFASAISVTIIFHIGYYFGANYDLIVHYLSEYSHVVFTILVFAALYFFIRKLKSK